MRASGSVESGPRIVLLWHSFQSANLGVGALSICNLALVRAACAKVGVTPTFTVIGFPGPADYRQEAGEGVEFVAINTKLDAFGTAIRRSIGAAHLIIDIGEGDSFADIYGARWFYRQMLLKGMALMLRRPLMLAPQTIGPFDDRFRRGLAARVIRRCALVCTRDGQSSAFVREMTDEATLHEFTDVAFGLDFVPPPPRNETGGRLRVGLNVSGLLYEQSKRSANSFGLRVAYHTLIHEIIDRLKARGAEIHLVPHVISARPGPDNDWPISETLSRNDPDLILPAAFASPVAAKSYVAGLDLLIGARMHATIAAVSSGVPTIALGYSRKFTGLFETLGYPLVVDMRAVDHASALAQIDAGLDDVTSLRERAAAARSAALERLDGYRARLASVIERVATAR